MSGTAGGAPPAGAPGLVLGLRGCWTRRAVQRSRVRVQTYLLSGSGLPPPAGGGRGPKAPVKLPSLVVQGPGRRSSLTRLSLSEPSLLTPNENIHLEGSSSNHRPSGLQKRPPPPPPLSRSSLLPSKTCQPHGQQVRTCRGTAYIHFSQAIQPSSRPRPARRHSHNPILPTDTSELQPPAMQHQVAPLSVIGKPCVLSCSQRPSVAAAAGSARPQLHVFLPTEAEAEGEEVDSESVDEGFMDELDSKITSLKLQQGVPRAVAYP